MRQYKEYCNVTDFTADGKCSCCGQCCSNFLPISKSEVQRIKRYVKKHNIKEKRHNFCSGLDATCPFRDEERKVCAVYPVRPQICKQFVCNHTVDDIRNARDKFLGEYDIVSMRYVFFGNEEDKYVLGYVFKAMSEKAL